MVGPEAGGEAGSLKILITGGGGFIGSHLSEELLERGYEVFVREPGGTTKVRHLIGHPRFRVVRDSVMDVSILDSLIAQVDIVFHLAAVVGVEHYVGDPYQVLNVNVNGTQNVLKAAFKYGRKVVFSSTSEVYGRNPNLPWAEDDGRRALLLCLPPTRFAGHDPPVLQHLRASPRQTRCR
jgi:nucleoside-diphosphate-sugar epimerase